MCNCGRRNAPRSATRGGRPQVGPGQGSMPLQRTKTQQRALERQQNVQKQASIIGGMSKDRRAVEIRRRNAVLTNKLG